MSISEKHIESLYETILKLKTVEDCKLFFEDVCTYKEVEQMAQRIAAAKLLLEGKTYEEVIKETDISSATLSRVSKCVKYGNGYRKILNEQN
jgi:TrpR-related protein YerC/YecD